MRRKKRKTRALALATVLVLIALLGTVTTAMVALFTTNLNLLQGSNNGQIALDEAEAGLNQVLLNLAADPDYGTHSEVLRRTLNPGYSPTDCYHEVSFSTSQAPFSTNAKAGATTGYGGRPVAAECVHVISTGHCRGQVRTLEAIIRQPPFNFALASAGPSRSANPLRVEGIKSRENYVQGQSQPLPGHIASNSPQGITVLGLSGLSSFISGQARSTGTVTMDPDATVMEGSRSNAAQLPLPSIDVTSFDPIGTQGLQTITTSTYTQNTPLAGTHRFNQATNFTQAQNLTNGLLYVAGGATFEHGLTGSGALIVDGDLTIRGTDTQLSGSDTVAILCSGKVTIEGDPNQAVSATVSANFINGLVYGAKGVDLSNITVAGIVLTQDEQNPTNLTNSNLMYVADASNISIPIAPQISSGDAEIPPIFYGRENPPGTFEAMPPGAPGGVLYVGRPPGQLGTGWDAQVDTPPGSHESLQDYLRAEIANNPGGVQVGQLAEPGFNAVSPNAMLLADWIRNPNSNVTHDDMLNEVLHMIQGTAPVTTSSWRVETPGSTFTLDLNNFLPRSSTLRVTGLCLHNRRL